MLKRLEDHSQLNIHTGKMCNVRSLLHLCVGLRYIHTTVFSVTIRMHQKLFEIGLLRTAAA